MVNPVNPAPSPAKDPDKLPPETNKDPVITAEPEKGKPAPDPPPPPDAVTAVPFNKIEPVIFKDPDILGLSMYIL